MASIEGVTLKTVGPSLYYPPD